MAFIQPTPSTSTLWVNNRVLSPEASTTRARVKDYSNDDELPRRKLVDRSDVYYKELSPPTASSDVKPYTPPELELAQDQEELCFLDELPGTDAGQTCFVSDTSPLSSSDTSLGSLPFNTRVPPTATMLIIRFLPFVTPILAYLTYASFAQLFNRLVQLISSNNWVAVDGGQYQANIITPAINGLVVPSIALLFATMTSNTINTLRQRQLQIRTSLNTEANDLRMLSTMVDSLPPDLLIVKNHLRDYLVQYASRVIAESRPGLSVDSHMFIGSMDNEMDGFLGTWNKLSMSQYGTMYVDTFLPASNYTVSQSYFDPYQNQLGVTPQERQRSAPFLSAPIFSETYDGLTRLRHERSTRLSALQSTYPALHYVILVLLAGSICTVFLMETNQELLIFLSAIQLRILWSMLIGTYTALAVVNYDMRDPFQGTYTVAISVDQFYTIREAILAMIRMDQGNVSIANGSSKSGQGIVYRDNGGSMIDQENVDTAKGGSLIDQGSVNRANGGSVIGQGNVDGDNGGSMLDQGYAVNSDNGESSGSTRGDKSEGGNAYF